MSDIMYNNGIKWGEFITYNLQLEFLFDTKSSGLKKFEQT